MNSPIRNFKNTFTWKRRLWQSYSKNDLNRMQNGQKWRLIWEWISKDQKQKRNNSNHSLICFCRLWSYFSFVLNLKRIEERPIMRNNGEVLKRINLAILGYLAKKGHRKAKWAKMADLEADFTETTYKRKNWHCSFTSIWSLAIVVTDRKRNSSLQYKILILPLLAFISLGLL